MKKSKNEEKQNTIKIAFTGHRFLNKYWSDFKKEKSNFIKKLRLYLSTLEGNYMFVVGGATGVDSLAAEYAIRNGIVFDLYVPFPVEIHSKFWDKKDKLFLLKSHSLCRKKKIIASRYYVGAYFQRDQAMVDDADLLISWYKKCNSKSGSANCVKYASTKGLPVIDLRRKQL